MIYAREARKLSNNSELTLELEKEISRICETEIAPKIMVAISRGESSIMYKNKRMCERNFYYAIIEYLNNYGYEVEAHEGIIFLEW